MRVGAGEQTVVCVLGMSRSGTSLTTRVLNLAGVFLGPEEELLGGDLRQLAGEGERVLAKARNSNPEGHWEHYRLMRLNERILQSLGGNWREPPAMPPGWESSQQLATEREQARVLVAESFDGHELWGWKDPRNSLTVPFWQKVLPVEMRYVICLRNPLDVAASLERRDAMPVQQGLELWRTYLIAALAGTDGHPRLFVSYEDFFTECAGTAARLASFVGREGAFEGEQGRRRLDDVIDERLWRNRTPVKEIVSDGRVPGEVAELHRLTEKLVAAEAADVR